MSIINLRIFNDENDVMNKSLLDVNGDILLVMALILGGGRSTVKGKEVEKDKEESLLKIWSGDVKIGNGQDTLKRKSKDFNGFHNNICGLTGTQFWNVWGAT